MTVNMQFILILLFLVCECIAAAGVPDPPRVRFGWLGLVFFAFSLLVGGHG